jgi:hypothetical protein
MVEIQDMEQLASLKILVPDNGGKVKTLIFMEFISSSENFLNYEVKRLKRRTA